MESSEVKPVGEGEQFAEKADTEIPEGFEVEPGNDGQHYWRLRGKNGRIVAVGGEGFSSRAAAIRSIGTVKRLVGELLGYEAEVRAIEDADEAEQVAADEAKTG